jgi:hypothetical protein
MYEGASLDHARNDWGFDWDAGNLEKCQKHGVSLGEIEALLSSDPGFAPEPNHSAQEDRFIAVGRNAAGRPFLWPSRSE